MKMILASVQVSRDIHVCACAYRFILVHIHVYTYIHTYIHTYIIGSPIEAERSSALQVFDFPA